MELSVELEEIIGRTLSNSLRLFVNLLGWDFTGRLIVGTASILRVFYPVSINKISNVFKKNDKKEAAINYYIYYTIKISIIKL